MIPALLGTRTMLSDHPDREAITDELHARPIDIIESPARMRRLVLVPPASGSMDDLIDRFDAFCRAIAIERVALVVCQTSFTASGYATT